MAKRKPKAARKAQPSARARRRRRALTVAVAGFGAIGKTVARKLDRGIPGLRLVAVSARDLGKARASLGGFKRKPAVVALNKLPGMAEVIVECLPAASFAEIAIPALKRGRTLVAVTVGALLNHPNIDKLAARHGGRVIVPTGALIGLDAVRAAAEGEIRSVRMVSRKPPRGLAGAPHLVANDIEVSGIDAPRKVFEGSAREAVRGFPANVNVAAALSLAGIGPDRTTIEVWADPGIDRNTHAIEVEADSARFSMSIANVPSEENPRTGRITALSVVAALRRLTAPLAIGT
ncbi:MAG: aspartate dehydrogenase [Rhodospirillales bacterium]